MESLERRTYMTMDTEAELKTGTFEELAVIHIDSIYRFALLIVGNKHDAQNLVQDTYLRAYKSFDKLEKNANCRIWLLKTLKDTLSKSIQRNTRNSKIAYISVNEEIDNESSTNNTSEDETSENLLENAFFNAIIALPIKFRIFILLADVENFSYKEISYIIGCSIEIVKSVLYRGHRLLNKKLQCYAVPCGYVENQQYIFNL
jgi:RNA polymerase sigma-70 factor (ECF subfamily)